MPNSTSITGSKWFRCDQCGRFYPVKYLIRQRGLRVCTYLPCHDEPGGQSEPDNPLRVQFTDPEEVDDVF